MAKIYSQAYLTIAAAGASSGTVGCLFPRQSLLRPGLQRPCSISQFQCDNVPSSPRINARYRCQFHIQFDGRMYFGASTGAPLWTRAWAFQERYLSNRTIHFHAEEMIWECLSNTKTASADITHGKIHTMNPRMCITNYKPQTPGSETLFPKHVDEEHGRKLSKLGCKLLNNLRN